VPLNARSRDVASLPAQLRTTAAPCVRYQPDIFSAAILSQLAALILDANPVHLQECSIIDRELERTPCRFPALRTAERPLAVDDDPSMTMAAVFDLRHG
jgi:hypothetical protein